MVAKKDCSYMLGQVYGRWTVTRVYRKGTHNVADCTCSCGNSKQGIRISTIENGESHSCGCYAKERASKLNTTHGNSKHPMFQAYYDMVRRCTNPSRKDYHHYGGRGIKVCDRWLEPNGEGFKNFLEDSKDFEGEGGEIDRVDVDGNYCPENCKWATRKEQTRNTRFNHVIEYKGESKCMAEWAEDFGIPYRILQDRLGKLGWSVEKAFTHPFKVKRVVLCREGKQFLTNEVFKLPPNHYCKARRLGINFHQYLATLFKDDFSVVLHLAQDEIGVKYLDMDLGEINLNLTPEFEQYCRDNGLTIGGRLV